MYFSKCHSWLSNSYLVIYNPSLKALIIYHGAIFECFGDIFNIYWQNVWLATTVEMLTWCKTGWSFIDFSRSNISQQCTDVHSLSTLNSQNMVARCLFRSQPKENESSKAEHPHMIGTAYRCWKELTIVNNHFRTLNKLYKLISTARRMERL